MTDNPLWSLKEGKITGQQGFREEKAFEKSLGRWQNVESQIVVDEN